MAKYRIGADNAGSGTRKCLDKIIEVVKDGGKNEVVDLGIDRNLEGKLVSDNQTIGVFVVNGICLGTMASCYEVVKKGKCKEIFFAIPQEIYTGHTIKSAEDIKTKKIKLDSRQGGGWSKLAYEMEGKYSTQEICDKLDGINYAYGQTCEEVGQQILAGGGAGSGGSSEESSSSGGMQIKDKTFEDCIRRICAATDSIFIVENNAAVLFPYTDWMAFTLQKDMETISKDNIDPDIFQIEYNTNGTYNKVTATWGESKDKKQTSSTKSTKNGKFTTKEKNNKDGTATISKQYDSLVEQFGELEKTVEINAKDRNTVEYIVNALLIQYIREFNNAYHVRSLNKTKYVGGTFYAIENLYNNKKDILYLNGYTVRTQKDEPLYIDLDFKYGPERVENIEDYQEYSGAGGGDSSSSGGAISGNLLEIGKQLAKYKYCSGSGAAHTYEQMKKKKCGDCYAMSDALFTELSNAGYTVKIVQYASSSSNSGTHRTVMYKEAGGSGDWKDFPYDDCGFDTKFKVIKGRSKNGKVIKTNEGSGGSSGSSGSGGGQN